MKKEIITIVDCGGVPRQIHSDAFVRAFAENAYTIFGMEMAAISALRAEFLKRGGSPAEITSDNIRNLFGAK